MRKNHSKKKLIIFVAIVSMISIVLYFNLPLQTPSGDVSGPTVVDKSVDTEISVSVSEPEIDSGGTENSNEFDISAEVTEAKLREWYIARGYYSSVFSGERHPYAFYDLQTISDLAANGDSLAKLLAAGRLYLSPDTRDKAVEYYIDAAVDGQTAGLVTLAIDGLYDFEARQFDASMFDENGRLTSEALASLSYFAAAEYLNDRVASGNIIQFLESRRLLLTNEEKAQVCVYGRVIADRIQADRSVNGLVVVPDVVVPDFEWPIGFCNTADLDNF